MFNQHFGLRKILMAYPDFFLEHFFVRKPKNILRTPYDERKHAINTDSEPCPEILDSGLIMIVINDYIIVKNMVCRLYKPG